jgi:fatty-acyl-CoA synthase
MKIANIRNTRDIKAIEAQPYAGFMPHQNIYVALQSVATNHASRRAITYISDAAEKYADGQSICRVSG